MPFNSGRLNSNARLCRADLSVRQCRIRNPASYLTAAEEPRSVELDVTPPIPGIPETATCVSSYTQTPGNGETKEQLQSLLGDIQAEEANRRLKEPTSVELEVTPPISDIPETATYVSTCTQTPGNGETKEQLQSLLGDIQAEEANRQLEEQTQLIRQLLTQQWETAEEQRRSSVSDCGASCDFRFDCIICSSALDRQGTDRSRPT
jgi:hypothetical protein